MTQREILLPCPCGKIHKLPDPGSNVRIRCRGTGASLLYECQQGDEFRLRGEQKDYILDRDSLEVGRRSDEGITLNHPTLSRRHCCLYATPEGYAVEDLDSRNGTFVNEVRLQSGERIALQPGDLLRLGKMYLRYIVPEDIALVETAVRMAPSAGEPDAADEESSLPEPSRRPSVVVDAQLDVQSVASGSDSLSGVNDPLVGREVGVYLIQEVLSQGGMGRIYRAVHTSLDRECVLKTIRPELAEAEEVMERFMREITLGAKVWHPNVIAFYDAGQCDEFWYLAMEYFPSRNLWELFSNAPASPDEAVQIGVQATAALEAAHAERVIHRDIKPRNLLRDESGLVKIVDFGVAKVCQDPRYSTLTLSGTIVGTPAYMAPEQISQPEKVDHRADLYALGAVLYFCLTGRPPYVGRNAGQVLRQVGKSVPRPSQLRRGVPPRLEGCIIKAMIPDPERRYQSAREFRDALEEALG